MVKLMERSKDNVLGFEVSVEVSEDDFKETTSKLEEAIKKYDQISWLFVLKEGKYTNPHVIYEIMAWALKNYLHFDRMAVVGDKLWEEMLIEADSYIFGDQYYDISELDSAWEYIEGTADLMY